jgi:hypothetical protein
MKRFGIIAIVLVAGAATWLLAKKGTTPASAPAHEITITARDFAFDAPDSVPAGLVTIHLKNAGPDLHQAWLVRLDDGKTLQDLDASFLASWPPPTWAVNVGGPNAAPPGGESTASLVLTPGAYGLVCIIPAPDGTPHLMKGMSRMLHVTGSAGTAALPAAGDQITLVDFDFQLSQPLRAGKQIIRVRNAAQQPHEVVLARLVPGKTAAEVLDWLEKRNGPPPVEALYGVTGIESGVENDFVADLASGEYGLFCFLPDAKDGKPHFAHGMVKEVRVD